MSGVSNMLPFVVGGGNGFFLMIPVMAGGISMFAKVQLPAPHGGIFVIPVMTNPIMYVVAVLVGSFITAALIGFLKSAK